MVERQRQTRSVDQDLGGPKGLATVGESEVEGVCEDVQRVVLMRDPADEGTDQQQPDGAQSCLLAVSW